MSTRSSIECARRLEGTRFAQRSGALAEFAAVACQQIVGVDQQIEVALVKFSQRAADGRVRLRVTLRFYSESEPQQHAKSVRVQCYRRFRSTREAISCPRRDRRSRETSSTSGGGGRPALSRPRRCRRRNLRGRFAPPHACGLPEVRDRRRLPPQQSATPREERARSACGLMPMRRSQRPESFRASLIGHKISDVLIQNDRERIDRSRRHARAIRRFQPFDDALQRHHGVQTGLTHGFGRMIVWLKLDSPSQGDMEPMLLTTMRHDRDGINGLAVISSFVACPAGPSRATAPSGGNRFIRR